MTENPYPQPYSPEHRVWEAARSEHGLSDEQVLQAGGWVPNDGTMLRDELLALYRSQPGPMSFEDGLKAHAQSWAWHGMRSDLETADAYADHMAGMHRAGELTTWTSHRTVYPEFLAKREAEAQADKEAELL